MLKIISLTQMNEIIWDFYRFFYAITFNDPLEMHIMSSSSAVK